MPQIVDKCAYEDNDCCGYFGVDVTDFNKGRKQGQTQAKSDYISCKYSLHEKSTIYHHLLNALFAES